MAESKYPGAYVDHKSEDWEYDGGDPNWTGEPGKLSPHMQSVEDRLMKEAYQKERGTKVGE